MARMQGQGRAASIGGPTPPGATTAEVQERGVLLPPISPVSREDDDLLDENGAVEVEAGLAHLTVSSPSGQVREGEDASVTEAPPPPGR